MGKHQPQAVLGLHAYCRKKESSTHAYSGISSASLQGTAHLRCSFISHVRPFAFPPTSKLSGYVGIGHLLVIIVPILETPTRPLPSNIAQPMAPIPIHVTVVLVLADIDLKYDLRPVRVLVSAECQFGLAGQAGGAAVGACSTGFFPHEHPVADRSEWGLGGWLIGA